MNPSVDISYRIPDFKFDDVNRVERVRKKTAGGKGLPNCGQGHQANGRRRCDDRRAWRYHWRLHNTGILEKQD